MLETISTNEEIPIGVRSCRKEDLDFIYSTWLRSYWHYYEKLHWIEKKIFFQEHHKAIEDLLARDTVEVMVVTHESEEDDIYGWVACESFPGRFIVHFAYVKEVFRPFKSIAEALLDEPIWKNEGVYKKRPEVFYTHMTPWIKNLVEFQRKGRYNPYLFY